MAFMSTSGKRVGRGLGRGPPRFEFGTRIGGLPVVTLPWLGDAPRLVECDGALQRMRLHRRVITLLLGTLMPSRPSMSKGSASAAPLVVELPDFIVY